MTSALSPCLSGVLQALRIAVGATRSGTTPNWHVCGPGLEVLGVEERIGALTHTLAPDEKLRFGAIHLCCLLMPDCTCSQGMRYPGGSCYHLESTAQQMCWSLVKTLGSLS